uniref:phosphatidate phosphatase n=1 Tax=Cyprinus carpio TaxID=7962 RepID=A0A8C1X2J8_CYPCA
MNYVGQLAGQVFVQVKELYRGLNPATLSGCIDVIVVRQPDGALICSPFHVRFGKMGVLRSREKVVDIEINGEPVDLHMKLGENGEAFFVKETEGDQVQNISQTCKPSHYDQSSCYSENAVMKKRRKRRRKCKVDDVKREESVEFSEEELFNIDINDREQPDQNRSADPFKPFQSKYINIKTVCTVRNYSNIISEGSCDTEDWSNDAENSALHHRNKLHFKIYSNRKQSFKIYADKKSCHLGSDGVYLDDIKDLEPEVAALYFPKSGSEHCDENGVHSETVSPQSMCSSGADSGVDSYDLPSMAISLCGGLTEDREITTEHFQQKSVSFQQFADNPSIIDDPNLVVKIDSKYYNWSTAAPILLAMQAFQKPLSKATIERLMKEKMPRNRGRWWFSWRGRTDSTKPVLKYVHLITMGFVSRSVIIHIDEDLTAKQTPIPVHTDPAPAGGGVSYQKTLRLSSEQLVSLLLKDGPNDVVFSVTTQYQGTCRCEGTIYLWNWDDKIIISDIDGTITRSDKLGHILPTLGKDWTHQGIASLYHNISQNSYKFLYCSARAIGMADMTRGYLHWVSERGTMLPQGPVLLSPSSLLSALHREVIEKRPEKFKVACLTDIKNLFLPNTEPFYAAFGNRNTDVFSYKEVGVPLNRIFTVNPKGELIQEHAKTNISSYVRLGEVVDHVFPLLKRRGSCDFPCSDNFSQFTFWREQLNTLAF